MMKKLLIFMLVLGMATLANAALQISVHNSPTRGGETWDPLDPMDTDITVAISDFLEIDIHEDTGQGMFEAHVWALIVFTADATLDGTNAVGLNPGGVTGVGTSIIGLVSDAWVINPAGSEGYYGTTLAGFSGGPVGEYYDGFIFHCESLGDAVIELWELVDTDPAGGEYFEFTDLLDTVQIHQIPEPATVLLLGLGGLFLRRRR